MAKASAIFASKHFATPAAFAVIIAGFLSLGWLYIRPVWYKLKMMEQDRPTELPRQSGVQPPPIPPLHPSAPPPVPPQSATPAKGPVTVRRPYPKPPSLFRHIMLLCLRPDQWAQAARYPVHVTLIPVAATIFIASVLLAINTSTDAIQSIRVFARGYDQQFSPLVYSKDTLSGQATAAKPFPHFAMRMPGAPEPFSIIFDPTAKAVPENTPCFVFSAHGILSPGPPMTYDTFDAVLGPPTQPFTINGAGVSAYLSARKGALAAFVGFIAFFWALVQNTVWALFISLLIVPFIQLSARRLGIPFRVAWRIALSITVPLVVLGAFLEIVDMPLSDAFGANVTPIVWIAMASGMAFWAGLIANAMYAPPQSTRSRGM